MLRAAFTFLAVLTAGAVLAACGGVPGGSVATVDGEPIDQLEFDRWMVVAAKSTGNANATVPDPASGYAQCVAAKRKAAGRKKVSDAQLTRQCRREYEQLRNQVLQLLISFRWIQGEANALGLTATDAEVRKLYDEQKRQSFPSEADYQRFLRTSGQTEADIIARVKLDLLSNKIRDRVVAGAEPVTEQDLRDFYARNKAHFDVPEKRDLRVVLTKRRAAADQARAALAAGQAWRTVARRYSIDDTFKLRGQAEGTLGPVDKVVFRAKQGALVGPVKTQYGYYVFTVTRITPARRRPFKEARKAIKQTLVSESQQAALGDFVQDFTARWRAKTICSEGFKTSDCANGPPPEPSPTPFARMR